MTQGLLLARPAARALVALACLGVLHGMAQAALFDDEEARKAIVELRAQVKARDEANQAKLAELAAAQAKTDALVAEQLQTLRRSLLELSAQIETLRAEIAKMRGSDEQLAKDVAELQRRQRDVAQGIDDRLRRVEPQKVVVDGQEFMADPEEKRTFDDALGFMRGGDFDRSLTAFQTLMRRWPGSGYTASALFWAGNAQYGRKDFKEAVASFRAFLAGSPTHARAPEAMLGLANSQAEMKDIRAARKTLEDLQKAFPNTDAATAAKQRLASLR